MASNTQMDYKRRLIDELNSFDNNDYDELIKYINEFDLDKL